MPEQPITEYYRQTYHILCPSISDTMGSQPLVTLPPFLPPGIGYVLLVNPLAFIREWHSTEIGNPLENPRALTGGLTGYRTMRSLRQSGDAPVSMPVVTLSGPYLDLKISIERQDAALLAVAARSGCDLMPLCVIGPSLIGNHEIDHCVMECIDSLHVPQTVRSWERRLNWDNKPPAAELDKLTCRAWTVDTANHAQRNSLNAVESRIDLLTCAGVLHTNMRHRDPQRVGTELGQNMAEAFYRMKDVDDTPIRLVDRFDAGCARLTARWPGWLNNDAPPGPAGKSLLGWVAKLAHAVGASNQASELGARYLDAPSQMALDWLGGGRASAPRTTAMVFGLRGGQVLQELRQ